LQLGHSLERALTRRRISTCYHISHAYLLNPSCGELSSWANRIPFGYDKDPRRFRHPHRSVGAAVRLFQFQRHLLASLVGGANSVGKKPGFRLSWFWEEKLIVAPQAYDWLFRSQHYRHWRSRDEASECYGLRQFPDRSRSGKHDADDFRCRREIVNHPHEGLGVRVCGEVTRIRAESCDPTRQSSQVLEPAPLVKKIECVDWR
jgi:hypothetical protein